MTFKKWIGEDEFCSKIINGASVAVLAAAALAVVIGLATLKASIDLKEEKKRLDKGVCPAEITVLQGDGTHYIRYHAELPCDKLDALARENRRAGK